MQPRCYHPDGAIRSWTVPITYFVDFKADLISAAKATLKPNAPLSAGYHCQFCLAKIACPEKHKIGLATAKKEFGFYRDPKKDFDAVAG